MNHLHIGNEKARIMHSNSRTFVIIIIVALSFLCGSYYAFLRTASPFAREGSLEHFHNRRGILHLSNFVLSEGVNSKQNIVFSNLLFMVYKNPSAIRYAHVPNPFPDILLPSHNYGRLVKYPTGMDPTCVPLIWDLSPNNEGWVVVLFCDGSAPPYLPMNKLVDILANIRKNGGQVD